MDAMSQTTPKYQLELTNNNANCIEQTANPSRGGHQYDNYWNRTNSAATFLAEYIVDCTVETGVNESDYINKATLFPNPVLGRNLTISNAKGRVVLTNSYGQELMQIENNGEQLRIDLVEYNLTTGVYYLTIINEKDIEYHKFIVQ
jgi:hypothetical protein